MRTFHEDAGFLSSSLSQEVTGVDDAAIWIFAGEPTHNESALGPRILVVIGQRLAVDALVEAAAIRVSAPAEVVGTLPPSVARQAVAFVDVNRDVLHRYWLGGMSTADMLDLLVRV
jgi:hypothetical protein